MRIEGSYWDSVNPIPKKEMSMMIRRVFKNRGYDDMDHTFVVSHVKGRKRLRDTTGCAFLGGNPWTVWLEIPSNPDIPRLMAVIEHELDHSCAGLRHKDMVSIEVLENKWSKILS